MVEAGILSGPELEAAVDEELAPLLGERDGAGEFVFPRPPSAKIDTLLLGCTHYPLLRPILRAAVGDRVAIVDSATATAATLAELLSVNGLEAPGHDPGHRRRSGCGGPLAAGRDLRRAADPRPAHDGRRRSASATIASRMFGEAFPDVESVELGAGRLMPAEPACPDPARPAARPIPERAPVAGRLPRRAPCSAPPSPSPAARSSGRRARPGLVDWRQVEQIAIARLRHAPGPSTAAELARDRGRLRGRDGEGRAGAARAPRRRTCRASSTGSRSSTGRRGSGPTRRRSRGSSAGSRASSWTRCCPEGSGLGKASMTLANRWVTTRQLGLLLGFMGQRVLGQYDLALLSAETTPGRLLFVEENIRHTARALDVPLGPFRTWIALHETTHAFEFEAHPWLRPYLADRLERQLALFSDDAASLGRDAVRALGAALRGEGRRDDQHWLERLMSDEQRRLFRETQAIDEPARGVRRPRDGRGGQGPRPRRRADLRAVPRPARAAHAVRAGDAADHRHGPQDGAVP